MYPLHFLVMSTYVQILLKSPPVSSPDTDGPSEVGLHDSRSGETVASATNVRQISTFDNLAANTNIKT